jgi:hypothetical protein
MIDWLRTFFGAPIAPPAPTKPVPPAPKPTPAATKAPSPATKQVSTAPLSPAPPSSSPVPITVDSISDDSFNLIVTEEDGSESYYTKFYEGFDWPEGASGPTLAIGYDCGYVTAAEARADWDGILTPAQIDIVVSAVGLTGTRAQTWVNAHKRDIVITWDQALAEFKQREIPKWLTRLNAALPNVGMLSAGCRGVLLSVAYNRGTGGFDDPSPRDAEMRQIKNYMATNQFSKIGGQILAMQRLWPKGSDLWNRRAHEAALYDKSL